jgi:hypothetical protein
MVDVSRAFAGPGFSRLLRLRHGFGPFSRSSAIGEVCSGSPEESRDNQRIWSMF